MMISRAEQSLGNQITTLRDRSYHVTTVSRRWCWEEDLPDFGQFSFSPAILRQTRIAEGTSDVL